jgi:hypothetical protein
MKSHTSFETATRRRSLGLLWSSPLAADHF